MFRLLLTLAARNVLRHKVRTAMTLAAIVIGVAGIILSGGFVQDIFVQLGEAIIHSQTGHMQIAKRDFFGTGSRRPEQFLIADPDLLKRRIAAQTAGGEVMGRLGFSGLLNNGRTDLAIVGEGIEPDAEARLGSFLTLSAGRQLTDKDRYGMAIGQGVAKALQLAPGDRVTLIANTPEGAMNTLDFEIVGVFQSFSKDYDARAARISLAAAQELLDTRGVNLLVVALQRTADTDRVATALSNTLQGTDLDVRRWTDLSDFYSKTIELYERQFGVLQLIVLVMVLLSVSNTVNMAVFERLGEFGTMRALGNRTGDIRRLIVLECALLGFAGAALGVALGLSLAATISAVGIPMPPPPNSDLGYVAHIRIVPTVVAGAALVGFIATLLAAALPAHRIAKVSVVEALRQNA